MFFTWRPAALTAIAGIGLLVLPDAATVALLALVVFLLCLVDAALAASPHQFSFTRSFPRHVRHGESGESTVTIRYSGRRSAHGTLRDAWQPAAGAQPNRHDFKITSGRPVTLTTPLVPSRRGTVLADAVTVRTLGPLRLAGRQESFPLPGKVTVLPAFHSRKHLPSKINRLHELEGAVSILAHGQGTEFDSLRDYVPGDDVRSMDWRATARRRAPVVRTWRPERDRRVLIVVDTGRSSATRIGDEVRLDAAIESTLLLSALASHAGDRVDMIAFDRKVQQQVTGATSAKLMRDLAQSLAGTFPRLQETHWPGIVQEVHRRHRRRALVVLLTTLDPAIAQFGLLQVIGQLTQKHTVVVAHAHDPELHSPDLSVESPEQAFKLAASGRTLAEFAAVRRLVTRAGAYVVDAPSQQLPPALVDRYLWLKAEGLL